MILLQLFYSQKTLTALRALDRRTFTRHQQQHSDDYATVLVPALQRQSRTRRQFITIETLFSK